MNRRHMYALFLLASLIAAVARLLAPGAGGRSESTPLEAPDTTPRQPRRPAPSAPGAPRPAGLDTKALSNSRLEAQIAAVVASMDQTGRPPAGVVQGGRRGGPKGVFDNAQGRLPRQPPRYYTETDVWPKRGNRGAERLVFGREGEVWYTADHYRTFTRLR